jgi:hypothetical protein
VAFRANGELRAELFDAVSLRMLNDNRKKNTATDCREALGSPSIEDFAGKDTFDDLVASASTIIAGRVISTDTGFLNGVPGSLISLRVTETYKSFGRTASKGTIHVFVSEATIPTRTGVICSRTFASIPTPGVGDDVLIFASIDPLDAERRILVIDERKQLVLQRLDHVYRPRSSLSGGWPSGCCLDLSELGSRLRENKYLHDAPKKVSQ